MTKEEFNQLSPKEQKQARHDLIIAACRIVPTAIMIIALVIKGFTN